MKKTLIKIAKTIKIVGGIVVTSLVTKFSTMDNVDRFFTLVVTNLVLILGGLIVKLMFLGSPFVRVAFVLMVTISLFVWVSFWLKDEKEKIK